MVDKEFQVLAHLHRVEAVALVVQVVVELIVVLQQELVIHLLFLQHKAKWCCILS